MKKKKNPFGKMKVETVAFYTLQGELVRTKSRTL